MLLPEFKAHMSRPDPRHLSSRAIGLVILYGTLHFVVESTQM